MKPKLYLFVCVIALMAVSSCIFKGAKPVTNKEETINALNAEWRPVESDFKNNSKIEMLLFTGKNYVMGLRLPDGDLQMVTGDWKYTGVGRAELLKSPRPVTVELVNDTELIINNTDIYKNKGPNNSNYNFKLHP